MNVTLELVAFIQRSPINATLEHAKITHKCDTGNGRIYTKITHKCDTGTGRIYTKIYAARGIIQIMDHIRKFNMMVLYLGT